MADGDISSYILRYNLITQGPEYFNGSDYYPMSLPASDVLTAVLTGFSASPGTVASTDTVLTAFNKLAGNQGNYLPLTGGALTGALSITGTALAGSTTSQTGVMAYLGVNNTNNRQLQIKDGTQTNNSSAPSLVIAFTPTLSLYGISTDGSTTQILTLGTASKGVQINGPLIQNVVAVAGTGTVTPTAAQKTISIPVSGNVTLNGPTGGYDGQALTIRVVNDGSHSVTLASGSGNYSFGTTITSYTNSVSLIDYIGVIYNSAATIWHVVSLSQGF